VRRNSPFSTPVSQGIWGARSTLATLSRWRKLAWLGAAMLVVLTGDSLLTTLGPPRFVTVILREWQKAGMTSVATAASFSVSAGSFTTPARAATFAAALDASGLPILIRVRPEDHRYQVLVGPYVSTDEAEHAQRALAAWGLGESRLVVDDTMRSPATASVFGIGETGNTVVMISAPGVSSIVFEMTRPPKAIEAKRTSVATIDVSVGADPQVGASGGSDQADDFETLALPDGVSLIRDLSVRNEGTSSIRAHVVVPGDVQSRLRLEGKRVYLDLAWPTAPWRIGAAGPRGPAVQAAAVGGPVLSDQPQSSREQLDAAIARVHEIEPFVTSAVAAPEPDVLAALSRSLDGVRATVQRLTLTPDAEKDRTAVLADIAQASEQMKKAGDLATAGR